MPMRKHCTARQLNAVPQHFCRYMQSGLWTRPQAEARSPTDAHSSSNINQKTTHQQRLPLRRVLMYVRKRLQPVEVTPAINGRVKRFDAGHDAQQRDPRDV